MTPSLVLGVGSPDRGDESAGLTVARRLRRRRLPDAVVAECGGEVSALLDAFQGRQRVVLVDTARSGRAPGSVWRLETRAPGLTVPPPGGSLHALGVVEALELARALGQLPEQVIVYVIEARPFEPGQGPSPDVERAVRLVEDRIESELRAAELQRGRKAS